MRPEIRLATKADIPRVLTLWSRSAEPTHTDDGVSVERLIDHDPQALLVAEADEVLVGSVIAAWDGWRGSIYRLAVEPHERRSGLGRRLLEAAEARFDELGAHRSQAIVVATDHRAMIFWRGSGWDEQLERVRFVRG